MTDLYLYKIQLSAPIPAELGQMEALTELWLHTNPQLTGQEAFQGCTGGRCTASARRTPAEEGTRQARPPLPLEIECECGCGGLWRFSNPGVVGPAPKMICRHF